MIYSYTYFKTKSKSYLSLGNHFILFDDWINSFLSIWLTDQHKDITVNKPSQRWLRGLQARKKIKLGVHSSLRTNAKFEKKCRKNCNWSEVTRIEDENSNSTFAVSWFSFDQCCQIASRSRWQKHISSWLWDCFCDGVKNYQEKIGSREWIFKEKNIITVSIFLLRRKQGNSSTKD